MKKITCLFIGILVCLCACNGKQKQTEPAKAGDVKEEVPPVVAIYVNGLPLFAPFNEGDIIDNGRILKQSPEKYNKFILNGQVFDVTYKEEKNKDLEHDNSYYNQYVYQSKDEMKGQLFSYANVKAVEDYVKTLGDASAEGDVSTLDYADGILVTDDYLKGRSVMKFVPTTTEDPTEPQFPAAIVEKVGKMLGQKIESSRIAYVIGADEYDFGVMKTKPNDKFGIAAWVLAKGDEVSVWTDTCRVDESEHRIYWSSYDPDEYMEPAVYAVVKGENGLDIYVAHVEIDEMVNHYLIRQEATRMKRISTGNFYQMYE